MVAVVVYGSGLSDGNRDRHEDLPVLIVGDGHGRRPCTHAVDPKDTPVTNLYITLLDKVGVEA